MGTTLKMLPILLITMACGSSTDKGELLEEATRHSVNTALGFNTDYEGERISVDGYVSFPSSTSEESGGKIRMNATTKPLNEGDMLFSMQMQMGEDENEVSIKKGEGKNRAYNYTDYEVNENEIILTTNNGKQVPLSKKLRITGTVNYHKTFEGEYYKADMFMDKKGTKIPEIIKGFAFDLSDIRLDEIE